MSRTVQEIMTTRVIGVVSEAGRTDAQIRNEITEEVLLGGILTDPLAFNVTVKDGIVMLGGRPQTSETGHEIVRQIQRLQGVVAVRDRLSYPDDYRVVAGPVF
jgi:osmotically-inducible protein OsmY